MTVFNDFLAFGIDCDFFSSFLGHLILFQYYVVIHISQLGNNYGLGLHLSVCLQNVSGRVGSGPSSVDSSGETITDQNATQDGIDVVAKNDPVVRRRRHLAPLHLVRLVLRFGLLLLFC